MLPRGRGTPDSACYGATTAPATYPSNQTLSIPAGWRTGFSPLPAAKTFKNQIYNKKITQSMRRKGNCWDNAMAESFFKILKSELVKQ